MSDSRRRQVLFVAEGEKVERDLITRAMRAFGIDTERFAILIFGTTVHQLIESSGSRTQSRSIVAVGRRA